MDVKLEDLIPKKMKQLQKKETRIRQKPAMKLGPKTWPL